MRVTYHHTPGLTVLPTPFPAGCPNTPLATCFDREVKLPGKDSRSPQSFVFGTPYVEIRDILASQDEELFRRNSVLGLLERDAATKRAPERWQALKGDEVASFDVVVCFESRVFDLVVEGTWLCVCRSFCEFTFVVRAVCERELFDYAEGFFCVLVGSASSKGYSSESRTSDENIMLTPEPSLPVQAISVW